jgi:hypothetical protein
MRVLKENGSLIVLVDLDDAAGLFLGEDYSAVGGARQAICVISIAAPGAQDKTDLWHQLPEK